MKILMMIPIKGDDDSPNFSLFVLALKCSWLRRWVRRSSIIATFVSKIIIMSMIKMMTTIMMIAMNIGRIFQSL